MRKCKNIIEIIITIIIICSVCYGSMKVITYEKEIEQSISTDYISDEAIVEGLEKEKDKLKKEYKTKIIIIETAIAVVGILGIVITEKKLKSDDN